MLILQSSKETYRTKWAYVYGYMVGGSLKDDRNFPGKKNQPMTAHGFVHTFSWVFSAFWGCQEKRKRLGELRFSIEKVGCA